MNVARLVAIALVAVSVILAVPILALLVGLSWRLFRIGAGL